MTSISSQSQQKSPLQQLLETLAKERQSSGKPSPQTLLIEHFQSKKTAPPIAVNKLDTTA